MRAKLPQPKSTDASEGKAPKRLPCDNKSSRYCIRINRTGKIQSNATHKMHNAMHNVNCHSNNLVYCISYTKCGKQYVGQTKNTVRQRLVSHFYLVTHRKTEHEAPHHFNANDHRGIHNLEIHVLEFIKSDTQRPETKGIWLRAEF